MNWHEWNWKTWGLVCLIALGGTFEALKRISVTKSWDIDGLRAPKVRPYATGGAQFRKSPPAFLPPPTLAGRPTVKVQLPAITKEQVAQATQQAAKGQQAEFEHGKTDEAKKKKENPDEWEIVVDPKTGKRIKRRKKNVAKKEEPKKEETVKPAQADNNQDERADSDADIEAAISHALNTGELKPAPPANQPDDAFNSEEEWAKRLLSRPNLIETNRFIDHRRRNLVSSDVFYKVVGRMLEDSRPEMKKLGILACAATDSPQSFQLLAKTINNSRSDASVKAEAEKAIRNYVAVNRLGILEQILKGGAASFTTVLATKTLQTSAEKNLAAQPASPAPGPQPAPLASRATSYKKFVSILGTLSQSTDPAVKDQAGQTLAVLQSLLGNSTTAAL